MKKAVSFILAAIMLIMPRAHCGQRTVQLRHAARRYGVNGFGTELYLLAVTAHRRCFPDGRH